MSKQYEVVTETERGTLTQLDGTETDLQGNPLSPKEIDRKEAGAEKAAEAAQEAGKAQREAVEKAAAVQVASKAAAKAKRK